MSAPEIWRPVVGWEGKYEVSNHGRVRYVGQGEPLIKSAHRDRKGYLRVGIGNHAQRGTRLVHRLVAEAFLPPAHTTQTVNHRDGDKLNNRVENLEWATVRENVQHAIASNLRPRAPTSRPRGEQSRSARLTEEIVLSLRARKARGETLVQFQRELGLSYNTIQAAVSGTSWAHLPSAQPGRRRKK